MVGEHHVKSLRALLGGKGCVVGPAVRATCEIFARNGRGRAAEVPGGILSPSQGHSLVPESGNAGTVSGRRNQAFDDLHTPRDSQPRGGLQSRGLTGDPRYGSVLKKVASRLT